MDWKYKEVMNDASFQHTIPDFQEPQAAKAYLHGLLDNMAQGLLFVGSSGFVMTFNRAAEAILGIEAEHILYQPFGSYLNDQVFGFSLEEALIKENCPPTTYVHYRREGNHFELEVSATFTSWVNGTHKGLIILLKDITEVRQLQRIAQHHDRMLEIGEMAAAVAHEVRNPLGGIKGFAALLERDLEANPSLQKMARHIVEGAKSVDRLITNALDYARPQEPQWEMTDLVGLTKSVVALALADQALMKGIAVIPNLEEGPIMYPVDPQLFKGALLNLIVNGAQAMPSSGVLNISLVAKDTHIKLQIKDTGVGISSEDRQKIFSPFYTTKKNGNGLGLAQVYKTVKSHGGTIHVTSENKETIFTIVLPSKLRNIP